MYDISFANTNDWFAPFRELGGNGGDYALKRLAQPIEIARAILYLTGTDSSYVTGAALAVDGGSSFH
jgi:NAD(P)-dependent dehydrogenase (short-subunit alcohol dehydrogenase family)